MPIDSALKRKSASGVPHHPLGPGVTPDVTTPVAWRASSAWGYAGIPPSPPVVVRVFDDRTVLGYTPGGVTANPAAGGKW